jgi:hypothetical protein
MVRLFLRIVLQWTQECASFFGILTSFPLDIYPLVELLDHMVVLFLAFWGPLYFFFKMVVLNYIPTNSMKAFTFLHILTNNYLLCFLNSHFNKSKVVFHCEFNLHFLDSWCSSFLHIPVGHLFIFWEMFEMCFQLFIFLLFSSLGSLYILILTSYQM